MDTPEFIKVFNCTTFQQIKDQIFEVFDLCRHLLPRSSSGKILLKPNLNSNMNALTGNTTDLRILASVIVCLKESGYTNVTIGEGTNSGFYRSGISVISRLKVDELASFYGVKCIDLNQSQPVLIDFEDGVRAGVASECLEADCFINMPKLKTHFEAGMSVCLKNLVGCLVGQVNKKKTHLALAQNIVHLTENIQPHLHLVDAIFAMEGLGPTKGTPVRTDKIFVGTNPYLIDGLAAQFAKFDPGRITPLVVAQKRGLYTDEHRKIVDTYRMDSHGRSFAPPEAGPLARFIHSPKRQKYFLAIRNTTFFSYLCNTEFVGKLLFMTDLRQDVFINEEMVLEKIVFLEEQCSSCGRCADYCPVELDLPGCLESEEMKKCISCLYCFCVCPEKAIELEGELGFMEEQIKQYDAVIRSIS